VTLGRKAYFPKATEDEHKAIRGRYVEQSETLAETLSPAAPGKAGRVFARGAIFEH
jgi:hypothetical protein